MTTIELLDFGKPEDRRLWRDYLNSRVDANYSDLVEWRLLFKELYGIDSYSIACIGRNVVEGVASVYHIASPLMGKMLVTSPFFGHGGLYAENDEAEALLIAEIEDIAFRKRVDYIEFRLRRRLPEPYQVNNAFLDCDLAFPESTRDLWEKMFSSNVRQNIRRSRKFDLEFAKSDSFESAYSLLSQTIRDLGTPFHNSRFFALLSKYFCDRLYYANVLHNGRAVAAGVVFRYRNTIATPYIGSLRSYRHARANYCQYWSIIEDAHTHGVERFEMGRSPGESTHIRFKRKWGGHPVQLAYNYRLINPRKTYKSVSNPGAVYRSAVAAWKRLPLFIARALGHCVFRYIP